MSARWAVPAGVLVILWLAAAIALISLVGGNGREIHENRQFNQDEHNNQCLMLQDEARQDGRRVLPCGPTARG